MKKNGKNKKNATDGKYASHSSHSSHEPERLLPPRGDYQTLLSFQKAEIVYDLTFRFAHKFLSRGDRTIDQMIQSARSGKKNLLEGSKAALTSKETEIKLTQRRPRQPRGIARRLQRLPARPRPQKSGRRTRPRPATSANWAAKRRKPSKTTASLWKPARPKCWRTLPSALSTRRIT